MCVLGLNNITVCSSGYLKEPDFCLIKNTIGLTLGVWELPTF